MKKIMLVYIGPAIAGLSAGLLAVEGIESWWLSRLIGCLVCLGMLHLFTLAGKALLKDLP